MNKYEKMSSSFLSNNLNTQFLPLDRKRTAKSSSKLFLVVRALLMLLIIFLIEVIITKTIKLKGLKSVNSSLREVILHLQQQKSILDLNLTKLTTDEIVVLNQTRHISYLNDEYAINNSEISNKNTKLNEQIAQLTKEKDSLTLQRENLQLSICNSLNLIQELRNKSHYYDKEINQINPIGLIQDKNPIDTVIESKIASSPKEVLYLKRQFAFPEHIDFKLLYRKSNHGYSPQVFHSKCDKAQRTIVLLHINNNGYEYKIGGYTSRSWEYDSTNDSVFKEDNNAFLFHLTNETVYSIRDQTKAILCHAYYLASFNYDLEISQYGLHSIFPHAYGNITDFKYSLTEGNDLILPKDLIEMEVFEVILK